MIDKHLEELRALRYTVGSKKLDWSDAKKKLSDYQLKHFGVPIGIYVDVSTLQIIVDAVRKNEHENMDE